MFTIIVQQTISHPSRKDIIDAYDKALVRYFEENGISYTLELCEPLKRSFSYERNIFKCLVDKRKILKLFEKIDKTFI